MHDADDNAEALLVPEVGSFIATGGDACGALKNGLEGDSVGCDSFLDDRKYLCLCILKCCENGLICMEMPEFGLLGAILD